MGTRARADRGADVQRLEVLEEYAERQQWDEGPQPAGRSHGGAAAALSEAASCGARGRAGAGAVLAVLAARARRALCNAEAAVLPTCLTSSRRARCTSPATPRRYAHRPRCTFTTPRMQSTHIFASRSDKRIDDESGLWRRMRTNLTANAVSTSRSRLLFSC